jgi:hypothetical protein
LGSEGSGTHSNLVVGLFARTVVRSRKLLQSGWPQRSARRGHSAARVGAAAGIHRGVQAGTATSGRNPGNERAEYQSARK